MEQRRINVRAIIWHEGKLLAVKHLNKDGSESDYWAVPGGGLDPFESLTDGVIRELIEETGVQAEVGELLFLQQFSSNRRHSKEELEFFYHIKNPQDFTEINLAKTTHGLEEIARIEFIDPRKELIYPRFLSSVDIDDYIKRDQPVYQFEDL
jgi:ADP-ribose pyrophosphatase YjhB (NUDIX family)